MGCLRLFLALLVMADHLAPVDMVGRWAVVGFFFLSGYTITASMQGKYKGQFRRFWVSRFWRLYPIYSMCWILAAIATWQGYGFGAMGWGEPWSIAMISFQQPTPIPPAWTFTNMLTGYLAISLGISRNRDMTLAWLSASVMAYIVSDISIADASDYHSLVFASLPFSVGAAWYWHGWKLPRPKHALDKWAEVVSYPVFLSHWLVGAVIMYWSAIPVSWPLFFASLPSTLAFLWALVHFDTYIRQKIRV